MVLEAPVLTAEFLTTTPVPAQGCPQFGDIQKTDPGTVHILAPCDTQGKESSLQEGIRSNLSPQCPPFIPLGVR